MTSTAASRVFLAASALNAITVLGHTKLGHDAVMPSLIGAKANNIGQQSAKIAWWELNQMFAVFGMTYPIESLSFDSVAVEMNGRG
jgi:hypothetical protein